MKILVVTQYFWPENFRINDLVDGLISVGHEVTVLTGKPNYPAGKYFSGYGVFSKNTEYRNGVRIFRVPLIPRGEGGAIRLVLNYISFVVFGTLLAPFYCVGDYDTVFVYEPSPITVGIPARFIGWLKKAPVFFWVQDLWPESLVATNTTSNKYIISIVRALAGWIYRGCDQVLIQSKAFSESIKSFGINDNRIKYFPNFAEELYKPKSCNLEHSPVALPNGFIAMFAGNIGVAQDFETILSAAEISMSNKNVHWVIVGNGRKFDWLKEEIGKRRLDSNFHLLGRHPIESMPDFFACADVMLVSLKKEPIFSLTIPAKVQSYMACAKPIIASLDGEGARTIIEANAGIAVGAESPNELAKAVISMAGMDRQERVRMGENALEYYNQFFDRGILINKLNNWMKDSIRESH